MDPESDYVPAQVVATWPVGTFVENIAALPDGAFVVSLHNRRELHRVTPEGEVTVWATTPVPPAGIAVIGGVVHVVGGEIGVSPQSLLRIGADGGVTELASLPDALFLNGFASAGGGRAFAVDSILGAVFEVDVPSATVRLALRHSLLGKVSDNPMRPGANGIKLGDGALWITNTDREILLRVPLQNGRVPQDVQVDVVAQHLRGDDLALDSAGNLYVTNHTRNTLTRVTPNGNAAVIAGPAQGMAGCTACAFGTRPEDRTRLYVTTTGGMIEPFEGVVQEAKLVRLDVGVAGREIPQ